VSFHISGLDGTQFNHLFALNDEALAQNNMTRVIVDADFGYPDRVSLEDASIGDELILLNYAHQTAKTAFAATGPIFVAKGVTAAALAIDEVSSSLAKRQLSFRAYDVHGMMVDAEVADGAVFADVVERLFAIRQIAYIHVHYASRGCFAAKVERA
jgi:hypothetical protein